MNLRMNSAAIAVAITWIGGALLLALHPPNIHEAISQYSVYGETWLVFAVTLSLAAIFLGVFGEHLANFWGPSRWLMRISSVCLVITAWTPYGSSTLPHWFHVISFVSSVFMLALALWRTTISFYPRLSNALLLAFAASGGAAAIAVLAKQWSFHLELTMLAISNIWLLLLAYAPSIVPSLRRTTNQERVSLR